jgi:hypothetical protein
MVSLIVVLLLIASFVLALLSAFGVPSKWNLHALAFALFVLVLLIERSGTFQHLT